MKEIGLYIHIPFCKSKCLYCDFNSYSDKAESMDSYVDAVLSEIDIYQQAQELKYKSVFLGGGTPTFIHYQHIIRIMDKIADRLLHNCEVTIECNPGTVTEEAMKAYKSAGINRLSIGLQAWQDKLLKGIGRVHCLDDFINTYKIARAAGFQNVSVDLMFSLPEQTQAMWEETLRNIVALDLEHVSCYSLKLEEGTKLWDLNEKGLLKLNSDEEDRQMYHLAKEILASHGLEQYEISNFAKPGKESRHNLIYWKNEEYLGIGAGSHSKLDNKRFWNTGDIDSYIRNLEDKKTPIEGEELIDKPEEMWETIFLALRLNEGLDIEEFNNKYDTDFFIQYTAALDKLINQSLVETDGKTLKLTPKGIDLSNQVFMEFM